MAKLSQEQNVSSIQLKEQASVGSTPDSTYGKIIALSDGTLHFVNDAGTDVNLSAGGSAMSSFDIGADTGTDENVSDGEVATFAGGDGIDSSVAATRTITIAVDSTVARLTGAQAFEDKDFTDASNSFAIDADEVVSGTLDHERGGLESDVSAYAGVPLISGGATSEIKYNLVATAAPDADNDIDEGYVVGSRWIDVTNDKEYVCLDNTDGAAVWTETTGAGGGGGSMDDFIVAGDSGGGQTISDGNTLSILGGTGIDTVDSATDTVTIAIDSTVATLSGTQTFTNKTIDADGTGNVITNIGSSEIKAEIITGLTADASPESAADYVMTYDDSAGVLKKVLLEDLPSGGGSTVAGDTEHLGDITPTATTSTTGVDVANTDYSATIGGGGTVSVRFDNLLASAQVGVFCQARIVVGSVNGDWQNITAGTGAVSSISISDTLEGVSTGSQTIKLQIKSSTGGSVTIDSSVSVGTVTSTWINW